MTPTPLDLVPGESLGPFHLGSLLFNVLNHVRSYRHAYPSATLSWDDDNPVTTPIYLALSIPPLHLAFDSATQRLSRIQVDPSHSPTPPAALSAGAWVSYRGKTLRHDGDEPEDVVRTVRRVLGPTYGSSTVSHDEEMLNYPGVAFGVTANAHVLERNERTGSRLNRIVLTPLPTPSGHSTPAVPVDKAWLHPILPRSPPIAAGDLRLARILLDPATRVPTSTTLYFHPARDDPIEPVMLEIGHTTSEDILCDLGAAVRSFWKEDDRMSIHNAAATPSSSTRDPTLDLNPYFLSYPHLGLTLMIQPPATASFSSSSPSASSSHVLAKIILHANLPGQINFGRTSRCTWSISTTGDAERDQRGDGTRTSGGDDKFVAIRALFDLGRSAKPSRASQAAATAALGDGGGGPNFDPVPVSTSSSSSPLPSTPTVLTATNESDNNTATTTNKKKKSKSSKLSPSPPPAPALAPVGARTELDALASSDDAAAAGDDERFAAPEPPMILDRTAAIGVDPPSPSNGGGGGSERGIRGRTTEIHGFPGIAFEVTSSGDVETVWLF
ncbi:hypothetical protein JCM11491_004665 [Sporobolomyces phaffii]